MNQRQLELDDSVQGSTIIARNDSQDKKRKQLVSSISTSEELHVKASCPDAVVANDFWLARTCKWCRM